MKKVMAKIRNKFKRHSIKFCIITIIIINNIYFWSDYFNIPSKLINVNNINLRYLPSHPCDFSHELDGSAF